MIGHGSAPMVPSHLLPDMHALGLRAEKNAAAAVGRRHAWYELVVPSRACGPRPALPTEFVARASISSPWLGRCDEPQNRPLRSRFPRPTGAGGGEFGWHATCFRRTSINTRGSSKPLQCLALHRKSAKNSPYIFHFNAKMAAGVNRLCGKGPSLSETHVSPLLDMLEK